MQAVMICMMPIKYMTYIGSMESMKSIMTIARKSRSIIATIGVYNAENPLNFSGERQRVEKRIDH